MGPWSMCRAAQEPYIASMGIYVLKASAIRQLLNESFPDVSCPSQAHEPPSVPPPHPAFHACKCMFCNLYV